jgi:DNA-binding NarL/FixJ family response regulator
VRVVVADDIVLFREGLIRVLRDGGFDVEGAASNGEELVALVEHVQPEVAIADIRMPPTHTTEGLEAAKRIRTDHAEVGVLLLSQYVETHHAVELLGDARGGVGYLLKDRVADLAEFTEAVRRVGAGGSALDPEIVSRLIHRRRERDPLEALTEREREILSLMAEGRSNHGICERLFLSPKTVETHVGRIFTKLDIVPASEDHRRVLAVLTFLRQAA